MFNKSKIMKRAWELYRADTDIPNFMGRTPFGRCLGAAWVEARTERDEAVVVAPKSPAVERIEYEIELLQYKSNRINIGALRDRLEAELRAAA